MKHKQNLFMIALAIFAGFIGGFISNQIFSTKSAFAEKEPKHHKVVIAEEFRLVDKDGKIVGFFGILPDPLSGNPGTNLILATADSKSQISLNAGEGSFGISSVSLNMINRDSNLKPLSSGIISASGNSAHLTLSNSEILDRKEHAAGSMIRKGLGLYNIELSTGPEEIKMKLHDNNGRTRAIVGNVELVQTKKGVKENRPVSSIVLFNEKGNVLWSAP